MTFSYRNTLLIFAAASAGALGFALIAQYGFSLHPCTLCHWQRVPYVAVLLIAALSFAVNRPRVLLALAGVAFAAGAGIAAYHAGVEAGIFKGLSGCSAQSSDGMTLEEMRAQIMNAPLVTCDQAMAHMFGLSMAAWNALYSALLALAAFARAARKA